MEMKYFRLIKAIAEEGSLVDSADKLFLTQSALSHQLRELEERLGFKVFYRTRNHWRLTEEGGVLYELGNEVLERVERGLQNVQSIRAGSAGTIKVSTECYSFYQTLPAFIQKMGVLYPEITVDLILEATHQPILKLLSQEIDMAMVTTQPVDPSLSWVKVFEDEVFALMHKEHPLHQAAFVRAEDIANAHLVIHSFPLETVSVYTLFLQPHGVFPQQVSAIPLTEVALEMVKANMGIMCVPKWSLAPFTMADDLIFKQVGRHGLRRSHYLVVRKADRSKKYIEDFIASFEENLSE